MPTTLRKLAEELDVSITLVSCVLNDKPGVWASDATRQRILEAAKHSNYRPSTAARALATGKSMRLAVSAADASWHHNRFERLAAVRGIIDAAAKRQHHVLVLSSSDSHAHQGQFEDLVRSKGCDGVCLYAEQSDEQLYHFLREQEMPFIVIGDPGIKGLPRVDHDNYGMMQKSVEWIAAEGRKRIASIEPSPLQGDDPANQHFKHLLRESYEIGIKKHIGAVDAALITENPWKNAAEIAAWLREAQPDALILRGLASTLQWQVALIRAGLRYPDDILLMALLNSAEHEYLEQAGLVDGLACHIFDPHAIGEKAGELLIGWINGQPTPAEPILVPSHGPRWC